MEMGIYLVLGLIVVLAFLFMLFNELEDECVRSTWKKDITILKWTFTPKFFNSDTSWKNKWKLDSKGDLMPIVKDKVFKLKIFKWVIINVKYYKWYYFLVDPKHVESFLYSSTIFVYLTDGEHLFQFIKKRAIDIGFFVIGWQYAAAWIIGTVIMTLIKERFLHHIQ
jgi:hypothetical protein